MMRSAPNIFIEMSASSDKAYLTDMKLIQSTVRMVACCALTALVSGCGSLMCSPRQAVTFDSRPTGAEILVYNSRGEIVFNKTTPCVATLDRRERDFAEGARYVVLVRREGCVPVQFPLNGVVNRAYYANILNAGIGYGVDPVTGGMWTLNPTSANTQLISSHDSFFNQDGFLISLKEQSSPDQSPKPGNN